MRRSESIANLATAMAAFQAEVKNPANIAENPFFKSKYAPLSEVLNTIRPVLGKHGLAVIQLPNTNGDMVSVLTLLTHKSGEWLEADTITVKAEKPTAQAMGSVITYLRRYALSAVLGISSEDDDDANATTKQEPKSQTKQETKTDPQEQKEEVKLTKEEADLARARKALYARSKELGFTHDEVKSVILTQFGVDSTKVMTKPQIIALIDYLEAAAKNREKGEKDEQ